MVTDLVPDKQLSGFASRLRFRALAIGSWLCIGLDPDISRMPAGFPHTADGLARFCLEIVDATHDLAACIKINSAFFEAFGSPGWAALEFLRRSLPADALVIVDAKRGDIGNTSRAYARALFDELDADAVTVNPYLGWDSLAPFLEYPMRGVFVLCKTSNPGSSDLQELDVQGDPLYLHVARQALARTPPADIGLVIGATQPEALRRVRALNEHVICLAPGVGAQGARAGEAIEAGANSTGDNLLASVSRDILYASSGSDFAERAREAAERLARETWRAKENSAGHRRLSAG